MKNKKAVNTRYIYPYMYRIMCSTYISIFVCSSCICIPFRSALYYGWVGMKEQFHNTQLFWNVTSARIPYFHFDFYGKLIFNCTYIPYSFYMSVLPWGARKKILISIFLRLYNYIKVKFTYNNSMYHHHTTTSNSVYKYTYRLYVDYSYKAEKKIVLNHGGHVCKPL